MPTQDAPVLTPAQMRQFQRWQNNQRALRGREPNEDETNAFLRGFIESNIAQSGRREQLQLQREGLGLQSRSLDLQEVRDRRNFELQRRNVDIQDRTATIGGIADLAFTGYVVNKATGGAIGEGVKAIGGKLFGTGGPASAPLVEGGMSLAPAGQLADIAGVTPTSPITVGTPAPIVGETATTGAITAGPSTPAAIDAGAPVAADAGVAPWGGGTTIGGAEATAMSTSEIFAADIGGLNMGQLAVRAGPAAAAVGFAMTHENFEEYFEEQVGTSAGTAASILGRTAQGAGIGLTVGGPPGASVGAIVGAMVGVTEESWGWLEEQTVVGKANNWLDEQAGVSCVIISACTDPHSPEVEVAREYRDKYMTQRMLRGYYMFSEWFLPRMWKRGAYKVWTKRYLVDKLISSGMYWLGKSRSPGLKPLITTRLFLGMCDFLGGRRRAFVRVNGEVF